LSQEVREFYDEYVSKQKKKGINIRHRSILKKCKKAGLRRDSRVLEIGCGIGTLTMLLGKYCVSGKVLGVDISPESISTAKTWSANMKHVNYEVSDMSDFSVNEKFDFVIFPDVLEHIPIEQHPNLFKVVEKHSHADTTICIHIPNPPYLRYFIKNRREALQIIDQPLDTSVLMHALYNADFHVESIHTYSLSTIEHDYQFMVFRKGRNKEHTQITSKPFFQKLIDELRSRFT
jgi:trans-aconitate 2-methyltransferase